ncbi:MAG: hypothetical protein NPIRA02_22770 [Nitrospirales bacterium]|nr:MAG: hypothetical protein NPIRA02_22770 [Nitrospirales bacterium]
MHFNEIGHGQISCTSSRGLAKDASESGGRWRTGQLNGEAQERSNDDISRYGIFKGSKGQAICQKIFKGK